MRTSIVTVVAVLLAVNGVTGDSCYNRCYASLDGSYDCQCNGSCETYSDCCSDFEAYCKTGTCLNRCGQVPDSQYPCSCDDACSSRSDCCSDYTVVQCGDSCIGDCDADYDSSRACQCNSLCSQYGNCCGDYTTHCDGSCSGECGADYDSSRDCQCNPQCSQYGNCCGDYASLCDGVPDDGGVPTDISVFATALWNADVNRVDVGTDLIIDPGNYISSSSAETDISPARFFTSVNSQVFQRDTLRTMIALFDNYITAQGSTETKTSAEQTEEDEFIQAIFETAVMQQAYEFVTANNYFSGSLANYQDYVRGLLFDLYSRKTTDDTSGFEHVFAGEWSSSSSVSGFHNWVRMYYLEELGELNYYGYMTMRQPNLLSFQFEWSDHIKPTSSVMYGASPEFEVAMFSTCFLVSRNALCRVQINGSSANVQTYDYHGADVFGSAYFAV